MLFSLFENGLFEGILYTLLLVPTILFSLCLHETAHGFVAWKCGDPTAYSLGRLTLNPKKHLDLMGTLCMLVFGFGWAKPVPINSRNFKNAKWGTVLTAAAGPLSNGLLAFANAFVANVVLAVYNLLPTQTEHLYTFFLYIYVFFCLAIQINFVYMVFNLIPIPPFDGSRILNMFLPERVYFRVMQNERKYMFIILIALMVLSRMGYSPTSLLAEWLTNKSLSLWEGLLLG